MSPERKSPSFVERVREHTRRYLRELNDTNGRLRQKVELLECDKRILEARLDGLQTELAHEREERGKLASRLEAMEELRASSAEEYAVVEQQNNNLASLYSATYSIHGTLERESLFGVIQEIVANLIGSEEMAIFEYDGEKLQLAFSAGVESEAFKELDVARGIVGHTIRTGSAYLPDRDAGVARREPCEVGLTACVPMQIEGRSTGAIAIFDLLPQKQGLDPVDYELFDLLGSQAAIALHTARLHALHGLPASD